jgi:DNA topoisomerase-3
MANIKRLFIAEKPSVGRAIAKCLGGGQTQRIEIQKGEDENGQPVIETSPSYIECANGDVVTWCFGHMLELAEPQLYDAKFKKWNVDDLPIVIAPDKWQWLPSTNSAAQLESIVSLIRHSDVLVNGGDKDREGDLLIEEVFSYAGITPEQREKAWRIEVVDLNDDKVQEALDNLRPNREFVNRMQAAMCRSKADWLVGMNYSRMATELAKLKGHNVKFSVGRVQTPTLAMVVQRDLEIAEFEPQTFYDVMATFEKDGTPFKAKWVTPNGERCLIKAESENIVSCLNEVPSTVTQCETKRVKSQPPLPFSLRALQTLMSKKYGMDVAKTLEIAQKLYEAKLTSYPRNNDVKYLPSVKKEEASTIISALQRTPLLPEMKAWADNTDLSLTSGAWNDKKLEGEAHTAIVPTLTCCDYGESKILDNNDGKLVYMEIVARYLAQFYPAAEDDKTVIELDCKGHTFRTTGNIERLAGWRGMRNDAGDDDSEEKGLDNPQEQKLPVLEKDESLSSTNNEIKEGQTTPPKPYTSGTLLNDMSSIAKRVDDPAYKAILKDTAGLGTSATQAGILKKLLENGYLEEKTSGKTKQLVSTPTGKMLAMALPANVRDPVMTAVWEQQLGKIESGEYPAEKFMQVIDSELAKNITHFKTGKFPFKLPESTASKCECGGYILRASSGKKPFWVCVQCDKRYSDDDGKLGKAWSDKKKIADPLKAAAAAQA